MKQSREGTSPPSHALAYDGTPVDGRDAVQESQHGTLPFPSVGLEGLKRITCPDTMNRLQPEGSVCIHLRHERGAGWRESLSPTPSGRSSCARGGATGRGHTN